MKNLILSILILSCAGCAETAFLVAPGVANGIYYGVKDPAQRKVVACEIKTVTTQLSTLTAVPDTAEFNALLTRYLPNNEAKEITVINFGSLYAAFYPTIKDKAPKVQLDEFKVYLTNASAGASTFCP